MIENNELFYMLNNFVVGTLKRGVEFKRRIIALEKALNNVYSNTLTLNRENRNNDNIPEVKPKDEWAAQTLKLFQDNFNTSEGSVVSMKRYGKYKGRH